MSWPEYFDISAKSKHSFVNQTHASLMAERHMVQCGLCYGQERFTLYRRNPTMHMLIYTACGEGWLETPQQRYTLIPDSLIVVPVGQANGFGIATECWDFSWLMLAPHPHWNALLPDTVTLRECHYVDLVRKTVDSLLQSLSVGGDVGGALTNGYIEQLCLLATLQPLTPTSSTKRRLDAAFAKLCQQLHVDWQVNDIAKLAACSVAHLHRLCVSHYNAGPIQHLTDLRMEHAARLLSSSDWPVQHIAEAVGYPNAANFATRFRKWSHGYSPREFRHNLTHWRSWSAPPVEDKQ